MTRAGGGGGGGGSTSSTITKGGSDTSGSGVARAVINRASPAWATRIGVAASAQRRARRRDRPALNRLSVMTVEHRVAWSSEQNACKKHQALLKTFGRVRKVALSRIQPGGVSD
ncbi:hypothetical protein [Brevundimonas sp. G8]|uniref:hypothetical protein n=1 Tax=Brevundimonas sp. G8 TaxID=1350776 RepID=UPI00135B7AB2|nr:hypothetical protein [Brevundimonas sp. G8]